MIKYSSITGTLNPLFRRKSYLRTPNIGGYIEEAESKGKVMELIGKGKRELLSYLIVYTRLRLPYL